MSLSIQLLHLMIMKFMNFQGGVMSKTVNGKIIPTTVDYQSAESEKTNAMQETLDTALATDLGTNTTLAEANQTLLAQIVEEFVDNAAALAALRDVGTLYTNTTTNVVTQVVSA
jgi:hypothetical protein